MKEFEICFEDLTPKAQAAYLEFIGGKDEVNEFIPIAILVNEDTKETEK